MKIDRLEKIEKRVDEIVRIAIEDCEVEMSVESMMELIKEEIDYENSIN
jgi:hypothetical protein